MLAVLIHVKHLYKAKRINWKLNIHKWKIFKKNPNLRDIYTPVIGQLWQIFAQFLGLMISDLFLGKGKIGIIKKNSYDPEHFHFHQCDFLLVNL